MSRPADSDGYTFRDLSLLFNRLRMIDLKVQGDRVREDDVSFPPALYVAAAVAYQIWTSDDDDPERFTYPATEADFSSWFNQSFSVSSFANSIDQGDAAAAIAILDEVGLIAFDEDEFAGRFLKVEPATFHQRWRELVANSPDSPFAKANEYGRPWLMAVFNNEQFWQQYRDSNRAAATFLLPNGMLRRPEAVVFIVEGSAEGRELTDGLDNLAEQLRTNNEIANDLGDERPRIAAELEASRQLVRAGTVRIGVIKEVLIKVLRELARKLKDKAVDLGIDRLLEIAIKLVGG